MNEDKILKFEDFLNESIDYKVDDIVLIRYWATGDITPVKITAIKSKNSYSVSFNIDNSLYHRAPDTVIKKSDIIGLRRPDSAPANPGNPDTVRIKGDAGKISNDIVINNYPKTI